MPFHLEHFGDKAIVVNTKSGKHYSSSPIPLARAKAQERVLESVSDKYEGLRKLKEEKQSSDPCWDGYKQIGMKTKKGKKVPNCVPE